jgi:sucrose-phosphate synthase
MEAKMTSKGFYIQMFSIHGLLRSGNMELGRDADTGGQIKYVIELANAISQREEVRQVELFTRLISDRPVSSDYAKPVEQVNDKFKIVRIQCGGRKYRRKELLWPHLDEFVDKTIKYIKQQKMIPDIVHGHYPDAGYVAMQLSEIFGIPLIYTGHSLGRSKLHSLLNDGMKEPDMVMKSRNNMVNMKTKTYHNIRSFLRDWMSKHFILFIMTCCLKPKKMSPKCMPRPQFLENSTDFSCIRIVH